MTLKILIPPTGTVDGISLEQFHVGEVYDLGTEIGCVLLAEQWAELVSADGVSVFVCRQFRPDETTGPLVLVVDDAPDERQLTESLLASYGYRVVGAAHGKEALARLRERCPALILLDLNMPVMDGWQFRAAQRRLTNRALAAVPVLVVSALDDAPIEGNRLQAVGVIQKPFDPDNLLEAVSAAVRPH
jgi:CheY-like chemotaxis protein